MAAANPRTPGTQYRSPSGEIKTYGHPDGTPYNAGGGSSGGDGGGSAENAVREFVSGSPVSDFIGGLNRQEDEALNSLIGKMQSQPSLETLYGQYTTEEGVPALQQTVSGFRGSLSRTQELLDQLEPNINERVQPFEVTEAQRNRMLASEQTPLVRQIGTLARSLGVSVEDLNTALGNVQRRLGFATDQQERELAPLKLKLQTLSDRAARAITGFTADRQSQLDFLMGKMNREQQLNDREWELAQQLSSEERLFKRENTQYLDQLYQQNGLDRATGATTPLGKFLQEQKEQEHAWDLEGRAASRSGGGSGSGGDGDAESWARLIDQGQATMGNVPNALRNSVARLLENPESLYDTEEGGGSSAGSSAPAVEGGTSSGGFMPWLKGLGNDNAWLW